MSDLLSRRLELLSQPAHATLLQHCLRGIERECLRTTPQGTLALTPHPSELGSALTHAQITTDYSEALLEFITGTATSAAEMLNELDRIHRFTSNQLEQEYLWAASMPCPLPEEAQIPIAEYGSSNIGQLKHVYRRGLALRYGKRMQCIAGIHYNFSLPQELWQLLQAQEDDARPARDYQSAAYLSLIRNFRRYSWLLMYLFGASPALDRNFLDPASKHPLEVLDSDTLYLPYATSLRMSDLGYQNHAQAGLTPCYDTLESYTDSLCRAVSTPYPPYVQIGTQRDGQWVQLNTNIIQIENEYYSTIRPKHVTRSGERPVQALRARGVQYIEVRCLDINPFLPLGIDLEQARFMDSFLAYCALADSPFLNHPECRDSQDNFLKVVCRGREPNLQLMRQAQACSLQDWASALLEAMQPVARALDAALDTTGHSRALRQMQQRIDNPDLTPSARVLNALQQEGISFRELTHRQSQQHARAFREHPLSATQQQHFQALARASIQAQQALEEQPQLPFDQFVHAYQHQLQAGSPA